MLFVTSPGCQHTLKKVKTYCQQSNDNFSWVTLGSGYQSAWVNSNEPKLERWLLIYSEQAAAREKATLLRRIEKALKAGELAAKKLQQITFACEQDAVKAVQKFEKSLKYHRLTCQVNPVYSHAKRGRPKLKEKPELSHYQLTITLEQDNSKCIPYEQQLGRFVLGSNDIDDTMTAAIMLNTYKEQQGVEQGFRFIKEPCFHLNQVFLKKPERIEALMMIMTLCLLIYNLGQHHVRQELKKQGKTLPNQKGQPIENPTLRWIFQMMKAINVVHYPGQAPVTLGLNDNKRKIIQLFGNESVQLYGLA